MGVRKWARGDLLLLPGVEPGKWRFLQRGGDLDVKKSFLLSWGGESLSVAGTHTHRHVLGIRRVFLASSFSLGGLVEVPPVDRAVKGHGSWRSRHP